MARESKRRLAGADNRPIEIGDEAPPFELRRTFDENVALEHLVANGPALIAFYVFDFGNV